MERSTKWLITILLALLGLALVLFGIILVAVNTTNANPNFGGEFLGFVLFAIAVLVGYGVYRIWKYPDTHEPP